MPWSSNNGSPDPARSYATETVCRPTAESTENETVVAMLLLGWIGPRAAGSEWTDPSPAIITVQ